MKFKWAAINFHHVFERNNQNFPEMLHAEQSTSFSYHRRNKANLVPILLFFFLCFFYQIRFIVHRGILLKFIGVEFARLEETEPIRGRVGKFL